MKTHAKNAALGGGIVPVILAAAAALGNASQQALNLNLQGIALAIYLVGFVAAAAIVVAVSVKVEGQKALATLGSPDGLTGLLGLASEFLSDRPTQEPTAKVSTDHPFAGTPFPVAPPPGAQTPPPGLTGGEGA